MPSDATFRVTPQQPLHDSIASGSHHSLILRSHAKTLSYGTAFTPPISLPYAPLDDASPHLTRLYKSNTIHTSHPSSLHFPRTPSSKTSQFQPSLGCPPMPPTMSDGPIDLPPTSSTLPRRWDSLPISVKTDFPTQQSLLHDISVSQATLESETEHPSPAAMKQNQYSKLRRHLGASIPPELIYGGHGGVKTSSYIAPVLDKASKEGVSACWKVPPEVHEEYSSEESESEEFWEMEDGKALEVQLDTPLSDSANKQCEGRYFGKWMREEGGRRWLMSDYYDIVQALREL